MTPVFFKCKRSGNLVSFTNENDIEQLRKHEGYSEVKHEEVEVKKAPKEVLSLKKAKASVPAFLQE